MNGSPGLDRSDGRLREALGELDIPAEEHDAWLPIVVQLDGMERREVTPAETQRLLLALTPALPQASAVRRAVHERLGQRSSLLQLLDTARIQVRVMRPAFWLVSAAIMLLGVAVELSQPGDVAAFALRALGPLLVSLGVGIAFRGIGRNTVEWELACPPSALELIVARLVIVLGYDIALGTCLSLLGGRFAGGEVWVVTAHWLAPLLLVAGLALALAPRWGFQRAATWAYMGWLGALVLAASMPRILDVATVGSLLTVTTDLVLGIVGVALCAVALARFARQEPAWLPLT